MKKFLQKRVLPLILAFSMCLSMSVVPAKAADPLTVGAVLSTVMTFWKYTVTTVSALQTLQNWIAGSSPETVQTDLWMGHALLNNAGNRIEVDKAFLDKLLFDMKDDPNFNTDMFTPEVRLAQSDAGAFWVIELMPFKILHDKDGNVLGQKNRAFLSYEGKIICTPYVETGDDDAHEKGRWILQRSNPLTEIRSLEFLSRAAEYQRIQGYDCKIILADSGYVLAYDKQNYPTTDRYVYASPSGSMYVAPADDRVVNGDRDHVGGDVTIDENTGDIIVNGDENINVGIDINDGVLNLPDGTQLDIFQTIYDEATKTYYVDARDESLNFYSYQFVYNIDYTSITYIGQTAEYNKRYEVYYELPDGRNSADLTIEELEQLNVNIDVIPYGRSTDDVSLRSLYHFDGDTTDDSFWNYATSFEWEIGSSITYMDAGVFNGALYLDEQDHRFSIKLPSSLGSKDFTIQWRYYQSHTPTAASAPDGFLRVGNDYLFSWDGIKFYSGLGFGQLVTTNTGQWMEIAVIKNGATLYYYVNGLCIGTAGAFNVYGDTLTFGFGSLQQTYKYFDELRVLNFAFAEGGASYTPTSVPHDTNLALVLPDSVIPVADEYWNLKTDGNVLARYDFRQLGSDWIQPGYGTSNMNTRNYNGYWLNSFGQFSSSASVSVYANDGYTSFTGLNDKFTGTSSTMVGNNISHFLYATYNNKTLYDGFPNHNVAYGEYYVASILLADGSLYSVPFRVGRTYDSDFYNSLDNPIKQYAMLPGGAMFAVGMIGRWSSGSDAMDNIVMSLIIPKGVTVDVVYMEVKQGTEPNTGHEFVESVTILDKDDLNTPSLAVKTDIDITGHQIGGVRPSIPYKGLVWAMVEGGIIKSLQIYNGSAWEAVDGRIWTGSRWVPYSAYNVLLMKDLYDISGTVSPEDFEYIYTEEGFWSWWQKQWLEFVAWLRGAVGNGTEDSGGSSNTDPDIPPVPDDDGGEWKFLDLLVLLKNGAWAVGKGIVVTVFDGISGLATAVDGIGGFFDSFGEGGGVFQIYEVGEGVWD